jgi:hypothetical protein
METQLRSIRAVGVDGDLAAKAERADNMVRITDDGIPDPTSNARLLNSRRITARKLLPVNGYDVFHTAPMVLKYHGRFYTFVAWNSDTGDVYYCENPQVAEKINVCKKCRMERP